MGGFIRPIFMQKLTKEQQWLLEEKHSGVESAGFLRDCERLAQGEPLDYIIGWKDFLSCCIDLSKRPLIPRVETEHWVEKFILHFSHDREKNANPLILDIFAGSGCVGIAVLKHIPESRVDFADISKAALEQIEISCKLNQIDIARYNIIHGDIFQRQNCMKSDFMQLGYDYILANPPYVAEEGSFARLEKSVASYEPHGALFGGNDGLDVVRRFLDEAPNHLKSGGKIIMEHDDTQREELEKILRENTFFKPLFGKDQYGKWRWVELSR
jgi:release factor glutamine methyltransferase